MPRTRRRDGKTRPQEPVEAQPFPPAIGATVGAYSSAARVTLKIGDAHYEVDRRVADYVLDLWQLLGSVATRITEEELKVSLKMEALGVHRPTISGMMRGSLADGSRQRIPLRQKRVKLSK